jgi:spore coat protein CotF
MIPRLNRKHKQNNITTIMASHLTLPTELKDAIIDQISPSDELNRTKACSTLRDAVQHAF